MKTCITDEMEQAQLIKVEQYPWSIAAIQNPSEAVQLMAVTQSPFAIKDIQTPFVSVQLKSLEANFSTIRCIKNPNIKAILNSGLNPNKQDDTGNTALHDAVRDGGLGVIRTMLKLGGDMTLENNKGETPLDLAKNGLHGVKSIKIIQLFESFIAEKEEESSTERSESISQVFGR